MTPKQKKLLDYIRYYINKNEYCPSFQEMMEHLGLKSKSGVFRLINGLAERGAIRRLPNRARAIEVVTLPLQAVHNQQIPAEDGVWVFFRTPKILKEILNDKASKRRVVSHKTRMDKS